MLEAIAVVVEHRGRVGGERPGRHERRAAAVAEGRRRADGAALARGARTDATCVGRAHRARRACPGSTVAGRGHGRRGSRVRRCRIETRQGQREGAALPRCARQRDVAAEQAGQVARDREPEAGAAVLAVGAAVGLAESLEDDVLLVRLDADAGVAHGERDVRGIGCRDGPCVTSPCSVNLSALAIRLRRICASRCASVSMVAGVPASMVAVNFSLRWLATGSKVRRSASTRPRHRHALGDDLDLARLELREIEDVVDQRQQVVARGRDGLGELHLLGGQVAVLVVGQELGQDQRRVEWRAQLVAHVGEKLALDLVGALELAGTGAELRSARR